MAILGFLRPRRAGLLYIFRVRANGRKFPFMPRRRHGGRHVELSPDEDAADERGIDDAGARGIDGGEDEDQGGALRTPRANRGRFRQSITGESHAEIMPTTRVSSHGRQIRPTDFFRGMPMASST